MFFVENKEFLIDIRYSAGALKAISKLRWDPCYQAILKVCFLITWITKPTTDPRLAMVHRKGELQALNRCGLAIDTSC